ncbi:uncharacterized protein G2W53_015740 [Senna tora]|uniref:Reverse transcriptase zinc-binding domain-containing protein n=1 Tax=Senna tora TaxID=362788 RepID=A0A834WW37_9FABA|nr:uncharacterized protein G2W53_015740 [Senna tora]
MGDLISPYQSAFIKGRNIADNILVAAKPLNYINKIKSFWGAWKIDLRKAYDKISWHFLEDTLRTMDFYSNAMHNHPYSKGSPSKRLKRVNPSLLDFFGAARLTRGNPTWWLCDKICQPFKLGGLGVKNMSDFNSAMLAKKLWRIIQETSSLFSQIMTSKYGNPILDGKFKCPSNASPTHKVKDLIHPSGIWDHQRVKDCYGDRVASQILAIKPSRHNIKDNLYWDENISGVYTVKDGYKAASDSTSKRIFTSQFREWDTLWKINLPPKIKVFGWKLAHDSLPLGRNLLRRGYHIPGTCAFGCDTLETANHPLPGYFVYL